MNKLITLTDITEFKPLSVNMDTAKGLDPYIIEAQEFDLKAFIGDPFFIALYNDSPSFTIYSDLWNGGQYMYNNNLYSHGGLKAVLIYETYARYLVNANSTPTAYGIVTKTNNYSDPIDTKVLMMKIQQARAGAEAYKSQVETYLSRNSSLYPLWNISCGPTKRSGSISISKISH